MRSKIKRNRFTFSFIFLCSPFVWIHRKLRPRGGPCASKVLETFLESCNWTDVLLNRCLKIHISGEICKHVFMLPSDIYILVTELNSWTNRCNHYLKNPYYVHKNKSIRRFTLLVAQIVLQTLHNECCVLIVVWNHLHFIWVLHWVWIFEQRLQNIRFNQTLIWPMPNVRITFQQR